MLQAAGVNATAYAAKLSDGQTSVIVLNKEALANIEIELEFRLGMSRALETESLQAPALESHEVHITTSKKLNWLKQGKYTVVVPRASGLRLTIS